MATIENILGGRTTVHIPEGLDADACACRAVEITGIPWRVVDKPEVNLGQG